MISGFKTASLRLLLTRIGYGEAEILGGCKATRREIRMYHLACRGSEKASCGVSTGFGRVTPET